MSPTSSSARPNRLRPRARLMLTIGLELISSETVALSELIKNSYDADASNVAVRITGPVSGGRIAEGKATLEVLDDGTGMDEDTIGGVWLEPATPSRRGKRSSASGRRLLGEKGVGRFAAAKLAHELTLVTRPAHEDELVLRLSWDAFEDEDAYLDSVPIDWSSRKAEAFTRGGTASATWKDVSAKYEVPRANASHGTWISMTRTRTPWGRREIDEVRRSLARLVSPFSAEHGMASEFTVVLDLPEAFADLSGPVQAPEELQRPHYRLDADISSAGLAVGTITLGETDPQPFERQLNGADEEPGLACGPFTVHLRIWDRDRSSLAELGGGNATSVRQVLDAAAGISVYRDGFRVLPYGEPGDDWLRLDARRVQSPTRRLSNNQIVGYVLIGRDSNPGLLDQTNREGLVEGDEAADLRTAIRQLLTIVENQRYRLRPRQERRRRGGLLDRIDLGELKAAIRSRLPEDQELTLMVTDLQQDIDQRTHEVGEVLSQYHRLATLGQLVDRVIHELGQPLTSARQAAALGGERASRALHSLDDECRDVVEQLADRLSTVNRQLGVAGDVVRRIQPFGGRRRGRPPTITLERAIEDSVALLSEDVRKLGVAIVLPESSTQVTVDGTELQEVLVNLLNNSLHWLRQTPKAKRVIEIEVTRNPDQSLSIAVEDSGPGVTEDDSPFIFDPYYTTREGGVGLGLSIAGEIVSDFYGGELTLVSPRKHGGARFVATLRRRVA